MTIQLHRLEGFYWVAREGGFAAAARAFPYPITQPGVHRQVRKLEDELELKLFERVGHDRMALTDGGRALYAFCRPFFEGLDAALERARSVGRFLRIDAGQLELAFLMPAWIRRLREAAPEIEVQLNEHDTPQLARLRDGSVDIIVDNFDEVPTDMASQVVGTHHAFFLEPCHDATEPRPLHEVLRELTTQPFVSFPVGSRERAVQLAPIEAAGFEVNTQASASTVVGILSLVEAGLGVSLVPWPSREGPRREGVRVSRVDVPDSAFPIRAIWLERRNDNETIRAALSAAGDES